ATGTRRRTARAGCRGSRGSPSSAWAGTRRSPWRRDPPCGPESRAGRWPPDSPGRPAGPGLSGGHRPARDSGPHGGSRRQGLRLVPAHADEGLPRLPRHPARAVRRLVPVAAQPGHLHAPRRRGAVDPVGAAHRGGRGPVHQRVRGVLRGVGGVAGRANGPDGRTVAGPEEELPLPGPTVRSVRLPNKPRHHYISPMNQFEVVAPFAPAGDQPKAIAELTAGLQRGDKYQTLLGVTGSGKTMTLAHTIANYGKPTLVLSHNKTLAAQLYGELRQFLPKNAVEYFVSYYDYYQPE